MKVIAWETTRRCMLKCRHCRGSARDEAQTGELSTSEGMKLLKNIANAYEHPMVIFTGGEPMSRSDIFELTRFAVDSGIRAVMSPCGPMINDETAPRIRESGISCISISLDGSDAQTHDAFRGVPGIFGKTLEGIRCAQKHHVAFQINCTISRLNAAQIPQMTALAEKLGAAALDLFFLVPTGRARALRELALDAEEHEQTLHDVALLTARTALPIRITCAPHFVRIAREAGLPASGGHGNARGGGSQGCLAGKRFLFVSHVGELQPCGFLQVPCGNVRDFDFDIRRAEEESSFLHALSDPANLKGSCGICEYKAGCGGCRARAYEESGDALGGEPFCKRYQAKP